MANSAHPYGNPNFDFFTALSGIGDTLADNRRRNAVSAALTDATRPDGTIDFGAAMTGALRAGDIRTATALRTFAERQYDQDARYLDPRPRAVTRNAVASAASSASGMKTYTTPQDAYVAMRRGDLRTGDRFMTPDGQIRSANHIGDPKAISSPVTPEQSISTGWNLISTPAPAGPE